MWEPLQRYRALDPEARKTFRRAAAFLPLVRISLRWRGFKKTQEWLQGKLPADNSQPAQPQFAPARVEMTCRMVRAAVHYGFSGVTCLEESLTLWYFLRRQSHAAHLRIGVRKQAEKFEAHAWVEVAGTPLNQTEEVHQHYAAFKSEFSSLPEELP